MRELTIAALLEQPERVEDVTPAEASRLVAEATQRQVQLGALTLALFSKASAPAAASGGERLLSVDEVAERTGLTAQYVRGLIMRGELPAAGLGKYLKVRGSTLDRWMADREAEGLTPSRRRRRA